jgi:hypothetical protein
VPALKPLFINLSGLTAERLVSAGGFFGRLLHLVQQREAPAATFEALLREEVAELEAMCPRQKARWLELLSYLWALVYHERSAAESPPLQKTVEASLATQLPKREVNKMVKTYADVLREEGEKRGLKKGEKRGEKKGEILTLRRTLLELLEEKFQEVPVETQTIVNATTDPELLRLWVKRVVSAPTLEAIQIEAQ